MSNTIQSVNNLPPKADISELRLIFRYLKPYKASIIAVCIALLISSSAFLSLGQGVRFMVDHGLSSNNPNDLDQSIIVLIIIIVILALATYARFFLITRVGEQVIADIRRDLYYNLIHLSPSFYESTRIGDIMSRMTTDTTIIQMVIGSSLVIAARNILMLVGGLAMMVLTSPELASVTAIMILATVVPIVVMGKRVRNLSRKSQDKVADVSAFIEESLSGIRTLQAYNRQEKERLGFNQRVKSALHAALERVRVRAALTAIVIFFAFGSIALVLWRGGRAVIEGSMTGGDLSSFVFYSIIVAGAFGAISQVIGDLHRAAGAVVELMGFLNAKSDIKDPEIPRNLHQTPQIDIRFDNVTFNYPTRPNDSSLKNISFAVSKNEVVALVGPSGAGKTTILQLLLRFYDCTEGSVTIDDINIKDLSLNDLRDLFAYVSQDPMVFSTSARENIRYGNPDASDDEVENAAKSAMAFDFITDLPEGFDTYLGEKGVRLSGGERQRIAIARAILKNPKVLLLDEATSALDAKNERLVQEALDKLMKNRTTIVIAHRLSTVVDANRILVMDEGKIKEIGTHSELIKSDNLYKRLAELQFV